MIRTLTLLILLCAFQSKAQKKLAYTTREKEIAFDISTIEFGVTFNKENKSHIESNSQDYIQISETSAIIKVDLASTSDFSRNKMSLKEKLNSNVQNIEPVLIFDDGIRQICNGEIILKLNRATDLEKLFGKLKFVATPDEFVTQQYIIKFLDVTTFQLFSLVSELNTKEEVEFSEPNFVRLIKPHVNDPLLNSQWSINNQGYLGGTVDADMDVQEAWSISTGLNVKVAIIDEGVDLTHDDLSANLLQGYDATGNNSNGAPNESTNDGHGTSCAGIVAAVANNNTGVAGVAYNSKIIPVRIAYSNGYPLGDSRRAWITSTTWIAGGINWAVQNGADILSNSWGGGSPSSTITNAINNAVNNGRNGKGCLVLFSSGNLNTSVSYPATLSNVIAVGATSMCDQRKNPSSCDYESWWGSNFGTGIDVVAPGVKVYSTDISGTSGYGSGDYISNFNGTSSSCPNVAGVAALILSMNPNFTQAKVRQILESGTDKISGYTYNANVSGQSNGTWNNEVGYGRVNACTTVRSAMIEAASVSGSGLICTNGNTITLNNIPVGLSVSWQVTPSNLFTVSSGNGNAATLTAINSTVNGSGMLTFTINSPCGLPVQVQRAVWVGTPTITYNPTPSGQNPCSTNPYYSAPIVSASYQWQVSNPNIWVIPPDNMWNLTTLSKEAEYFEITVTMSGGNCTATNTLINQYGNALYCECFSDPYQCPGQGGGWGLFSVYPNPADNYMEVQIDDSEFNSSSFSSFEIVLLDNNGIEVFRSSTKDKSKRIDTSSIKGGQYFLHVLYKGEILKRQVFVSK